MRKIRALIFSSCIFALVGCHRKSACTTTLRIEPTPADWTSWPVVATSGAGIITDGRGGYNEPISTETAPLGAFTVTMIVHGTPDNLDFSENGCAGNSVRFSPTYPFSPAFIDLRQKGNVFVVSTNQSGDKRAFGSFSRR
jgi:hypothetical protein